MLKKKYSFRGFVFVEFDSWKLGFGMVSGYLNYNYIIVGKNMAARGPFN